MSSAYRPLGARRSHDPHDGLMLERGDGARVWDTEGRSYLDFIVGYSALNLGHSHPRILEVAQAQLQKLSFCTGNQTEVRLELESQLAELWRGNASKSGACAGKVWLSTTGARAVEIAWKLAYANRPGRLMRFDLGYHGRSLATALITDTRRSNALEPMLHESSITDSSEFIIPFPRCGSTCSGGCPACDSSLAKAKACLENQGPNVSAMIIEPAIGARGYHFASPNYFQRLVAMLKEHGVQLISDEVQMGLGRLGEMLVSVSSGWDPDFVVLGKSLGGGITPISAVVGNADSMDRLPQGIESETFAANPIACRVAIEVLSLLNDESFLTHVVQLGESFRNDLRGVIPERLVVDGQGLATVVDLSGLSEERFDSARLAWDWVCWARQHGLLVHLTGSESNRIAIIPPLIVDQSTMAVAAKILSEFWKVKEESGKC